MNIHKYFKFLFIQFSKFDGGSEEMQTEAQKRAKKKYMDKTYKNLAIHIRPENVQLIDNYCKSIGMSKAATIVNAIKYLIENNVNLAEWIEKGKTDRRSGAADRAR